MIRNRKLLAIFIALVMLTSQLAALQLTVFAEEAGATIKLIAPDDVDINALTITLRTGFPTATSITEANATTNAVAPNADGTYTINTAGTHSFYTRGPGYYRIVKLFNVTAQQIANEETLEILIPNGPVAGNGYEPARFETQAQRRASGEIPPAAVLDSRDIIIAVWPDEVREVFGTNPPYVNPNAKYPFPAGGFTSPSFTNQDELAMFQLASMDMVEAYIADFMDNFVQGTGGVYAYADSLGKTVYYDMNIPIVVFSSDDISQCKSLDEVAEILRGNDLPTFWNSGSIHGNEPAGAEGVLVLIGEMFGDYGASIIDKINVVAFPHANADGLRILSRAGNNGSDMNRDYLNARNLEQNWARQVFQKFLPEAAVDGHEFTFYGTNAAGYLSNSDDIQTTEAGMLNVSDDLQALTVRINNLVHQNALDANLRAVHYGPAVSYGVGRAYYNLLGSAAILCETRGIGAGGVYNHLARRTYGQYVTIKSVIEYVIENSQEVMNIVKETRENFVKRGKVYNPDSKLYIDLISNTYTAATTPRLLPRYQHNLDGTLTRAPTMTGSNVLGTYYTSVRYRSWPTAYVLDLNPLSYHANAATGAQRLADIKYLIEQQCFDYYEIPANTPINLKQYYWVSGGLGTSYRCNTRAQESVSFPYGALMIPMDQLNSSVIAMTMEPDANDTSNYPTTLAYQGFVTSNSTSMPIYRYEGNYPRISIPTISSDLRLTTDAALVQEGDVAAFKAAFREETATNAIVLNYAFDGDLFVYDGFEPAAGVQVITVESGEGFAKVIVMAPGYTTKNVGSLSLLAKKAQAFEVQTVTLNAEYVLKEDGSDKGVKQSTSSASIRVIPPNETFDLIDLSNLIDWFGITSAHPDWKTIYAKWDFNNNGIIDIFDIAFVAARIQHI